jgi:hypothetical protein
VQLCYNSSGKKYSVWAEWLGQSHQRHPGVSLLCAQHQYNASRCISPSNRCFIVSSRSVGLLLKMIILVLWPTVTVHRNGFIGYALASGLQCDWGRCEYLFSRSIYMCATCNSLLTKYTHHSKSPNLCGY